MSIQDHSTVIQKGIVLHNKKIAEHTFHLKIQSEDFKSMEYIAGFTLEIYLGNPLEQPETENRKYSFWDYDPVYNNADIAICTFSKGKGANWIKNIKQEDILYFKQPKGKLLVDNNAENYLLIGDTTSLSHLYEINRNLSISKNIFSFIYVSQSQDIFPDIDLSYPLNFHIINPVSAEIILKKIIEKLPDNLDNTIAYIFGEPETCITIHNYFKKDRNFPLQNLRTKPFWKTNK